MESHNNVGLFERKPYLLAIIISVSLVLWMMSGTTQGSDEAKDAEQEDIIPKVEVTRFNTTPVNRSIELYGRTEPVRSLTLSSTVEGQVAKILKDEGDLVQEGDVIIQLDLDDKLEQVSYAKSLVEQREIEYQGATSLSEQGLQGESILAQAKAALTAAKANLKQKQISLEKSYIKAPFTGVLNQRNVEVGSFIGKGANLFQLLELDPLLVTANVSERYIANLTDKVAVKVNLTDGTVVNGRIRYIANVSSAGTNTFPIEVEIDNPNQRLPAGMSTEMQLLFDTEQAIKVSPALLALDAAGNIGVKTVVAEKVHFQPIDIIKAEKDGIWLGGFTGEVDVITLGQGFVRPGDKVAVSYKQ